ncbi:thiosulfate sulfurtransferase [Scheffersomyces xylosifermentans]|uniref:thiosulfate sulfurtransferase n=1 Tax=Scheffersomyces xylosifermentans TaxID=1304137 RepID=UPI00315CAFDD
MSRSVLSTISPNAFRALVATSTPASRVVPVDATWYMPNNPKNGREEFLNEQRLPGAAFFDLDAISLPVSPYPHMLPSYDLFKEAIGELGIQRNDKVVVYDKSGIFSSPRAAWTFALFGHPRVYLLDNYLTYKQSEYPVEKGKVTTLSTSLASEGRNEGYEIFSKSEFDENYKNQVIEYEELLNLVETDALAKDYYAFDARPNDRFTGKVPEPRPGLSSGHVPSSLSLPFSRVINEGNKTYKSKEELLEVFQKDFGLDLSNDKFVDGKKGIIVMCGSGVTAVILKFAIQSVIGLDVPIRVYDGSWTEWASRAPEKFIKKDY